MPLRALLIIAVAGVPNVIMHEELDTIRDCAVRVVEARMFGHKAGCKWLASAESYRHPIGREHLRVLSPGWRPL